MTHNSFITTLCINNLEDPISKSEETLTKANHSFLRNFLMINQNGTQCISIRNLQLQSRIPDNETVKFDGNIITPSNHAVNSGLYIDIYINFEAHVYESNKKVMETLMYMYINCLKENFQKETGIIIMSSLVLSLINYCIRI